MNSPSPTSDANAPAASAAPRHERDIERVPLIEEQLHVDTQAVETGRVVIGTTVEERQVGIDVPIRRETAEIRRVPVHRPVDRPVPTRQEGDVVIVSVHEEVPVVTRQLMLKEELHISLRVSEALEPQRVSLLRDRLEIQRSASDGDGTVSGAPSPHDEETESGRP